MRIIQLICCSFLMMNFSGIALGQALSQEDQQVLEHMETSVENQKRTEDLERPNSNQVFIQQVGNGNTVNSYVKAESSVASYSQRGRQHTANVLINAKTYQGEIAQTGNNNNAFDNVHAPGEDVSLNLRQNGRNLHFERYGSNSIGDKLEFKMNGSNKSIIVRNFK